MSDKEIPDLEEAIEQLADCFGFDAHYDFKVKGELYRITYRQFLPVDIEKKIQQIDVDLKECDRAEVLLPSGKKVKGIGYEQPLQKNGVLLADSRDALRLIAMWGEKKYRAFEDAGGSPDMLTIVWAKMDADYEAWRKTGSKSATGD
jgi:hypothetical protein